MYFCFEVKLGKKMLHDLKMGLKWAKDCICRPTLPTGERVHRKKEICVYLLVVICVTKAERAWQQRILHGFSLSSCFRSE